LGLIASESLLFPNPGMLNRSGGRVFFEDFYDFGAWLWMNLFNFSGMRPGA
jgi:hypothetical protein